MFSRFLLAFSLSTDAFGIGFAFGLKKTALSIRAKLIIAFVTVLLCYIGSFLGSLGVMLLPDGWGRYIGGGLIALMGILFLVHAFYDKQGDSPTVPVGTKQAFLIGLSLSLDDILTAGLSISFLGLSTFWLPFVIGGGQFIFLSVGLRLAEFTHRALARHEALLKITSGLILLAIGISYMT